MSGELADDDFPVGAFVIVGAMTRGGAGLARRRGWQRGLFPFMSVLLAAGCYSLAHECRVVKSPAGLLGGWPRAAEILPSLSRARPVPS